MALRNFLPPISLTNQVTSLHTNTFRFCAKTGELEDAPGLDHLKSYKVEVSGDDVYVIAEESDLKNQFKSIAARSPVKDNNSVVIVGGGAAGLACAEGLRQEGYDGKITILTKENNLPIDRTKLSKAFITDASKINLRTPEQLDEMKVTVRQAEVKSVDKSKRRVKLENGEEMAYSKLVLAMGACVFSFLSIFELIFSGSSLSFLLFFFKSPRSTSYRRRRSIKRIYPTQPRACPRYKQGCR